MIGPPSPITVDSKAFVGPFFIVRKFVKRREMVIDGLQALGTAYDAMHMPVPQDLVIRAKSCGFMEGIR